MSLRALFKLFLGIVCSAVAAFLALWLFWESSPVAVMTPEARNIQDSARSTRGTVLRLGDPAIEFILGPSTSAVRIQSNANLRDIDLSRKARKADSNRRWRYVLEIEEIRADGTSTLVSHSFRRDLVEVALSVDQTGTGSFYLRKDLPSPMAVATLRLDYAGGLRPEKLRIRLLSADSDIADVLLRVAAPEPLTQRSAETMWARLSDEQQNRLSSGNLYPADLLIKQERENLIASRWRPLGPVGNVEGRDIYVLEAEERGVVATSFEEPVPTVGRQRLMAIQLPETGGRLRVELTPLEGATGTAESFPAQVNLDWAGYSAFQRSKRTYPWSSGSFSQEITLPGGRVELGATREAQVRVLLLGPGEPQDITPEARYLRSWTVEPNVPLDFSISHAGIRSTPIRFVFRRVRPEGSVYPDSPVTMTLMGADGQVLRELRINTGVFSDSFHDDLWPRMPGLSVSDPFEAFFRLPAEVKTVRVGASEPLLVNGYSRPSDLARLVRTPEDTATPNDAQFMIPAWFSLQPARAQALTLNGSSRLLTVQDRRPDDRPELISGRYTWESFTPVNQSAGRVFLAPREEGVPERAEGLAGTFRRLSSAGSVTFLAEPGRARAPARLFWAADLHKKFTYVVKLDGQVLLNGVASGAAGEVMLPPVSPGPHHLEIQADPAIRWFSNYLESGAPWVKRRAFQFDKQLSFDVLRTTNDEEFVSVRLFRPAGVSERVQVKVDIEAPFEQESIGPLPGWLFSHRVYDVRPSGEFALPVAETLGVRVDAGQPFYIPFPKGAPVGRYRVRLSPKGGAAWVSVSRINVSGTSAPKIFVESGFNDE